MRAVYLLLRENIESGPYTIDELLQQQLRPTDLIWVEGYSHAWAYSYEIEELRIELQKGERKQDSLEAERRKDEIERKAESLRQQILSYRPAYVHWKKPEAAQKATDVLRSLEEEQVEFIDHSKRGVTSYEVLAGLIVVALVSAGIYGGQAMYRNSQVLAVQTSQAIPKGSEELVVTRNVQPPVSQPVVITDTLLHADSNTAIAGLPQPRQIISRPVVEQEPAETTVTQPPVVEPEKPEQKEEPSKVEAQKQEKVEVKSPVKDTVAVKVEEAPQKKSFGQVLKGLFKKKKKKEAADTTAAQ